MTGCRVRHKYSGELGWATSSVSKPTEVCYVRWDDPKFGLKKRVHFIADLIFIVPMRWRHVPCLVGWPDPVTGALRGDDWKGEHVFYRHGTFCVPKEALAECEAHGWRRVPWTHDTYAMVERFHA